MLAQARSRLTGSAARAAAVRAMASRTAPASKAVERPISPHVMVYAFPVSALSSITHRVTGVALTGGMATVGAMALVGADPAACLSALNESAPGFAALGRFCVAFPLSYHMLGGIRHMIWDANPHLLVKGNMHKHAWAVLGGAFIISSFAMTQTSYVPKKKSAE